MEKRNKQIAISLLLIVSLLLITVGVSVSFFSYVKNGTTENSIKLGSITFKYTENENIGNGISMTEALPMSDAEGKIQVGSGKVFDFRVESNLSRSDLEYEVVAEIIEGSTLPLDAIKFYITDITNGIEEEIESTLFTNEKVKTLGDFLETEIENAKGKSIYREVIPKNTKGYEKKFRVRMWLREDLDWTDEAYMGKTGSIRVNVYANSNRSTASVEPSSPDDVRIERVVANKKYLFDEVTGKQYQYTVTVPNEIHQVKIEVIPSSTEATVEISSMEESSDLKVGDNYFKAKVISSNKEKSQEYILRVVREQSKNTDLSSLEVLGYSMSPNYSNEQNLYEVEVPYEVKSIEVLANKREEVQKLEGIGTYNLELGKNLVSIIVTAEDGTKREIQITVNRKLSDNAGIENVGVTGYELTHLENNIYSVTVEYQVESVEITNVSTTGANVEGIGVKNSLIVGDNDYEIGVTSASGENQNQYIIRIIRERDSDNTLSSLELSGCSLMPMFSSENANYTCVVENSITRTTVSATSTSTVATISGLGEKSLDVGNNAIFVEVIAQNGEKNIYEIIVTRKANSDSTLKSLLVSSGSLSPTFSPSQTEYTLSVPYNVTSVMVTGEANRSESVVEGNGSTALNVGSNRIEIRVIAEDQTSRTYTIIVTREEDTDNTLKSLELSDCALTPTFASGITRYTCTVAYGVSKTTVNASATSMEATISGIGEKSLNVGDNTISIVVKAQDNSINTYTVLVHRKSNDATLKDLGITGQVISPVFASGVTSYTLTVPNAINSVTVNATKNHNSAVVTGVGNKTLVEGSNNLVVTVTAEDGNTKVYTIIVKRMKKDVLTLAAKSASYTGNPIPANTASATSESSITYIYYATTDCSGTALTSAPVDVGNYSVKAVSSGNSDYESGNICVTHTITKGSPTISLAAKSVEATGSAITANKATAKNPNGSAVTLSYTYTYYATTNCSGTALGSAPAVVGNYSVKAVSGATTNLKSGSKCVTHTITKNTNTNLSSLSVSGYSMSPTFASGTQNYTLTVEATSITVNASAASSLSIVSGTGSKTLSWGSNEISVIVTSQSGATKVYKITVTNQRPTAPTITGGSSSWVTTAPTISVTKAGSAISGVKHYEYYKSQTNTAPSDSTVATGTTSGNLKVNDEGTRYIWYRTVSNNGNKSAWTGPQVTNLDTKTPTTPVLQADINQCTTQAVTVSLKSASTATSGINSYEYQFTPAPIGTTGAPIFDTGTTSGNYVVYPSENGYQYGYVYYRAISNSGLKSEWSSGIYIRIDTFIPKINSVTGDSTDWTASKNFKIFTSGAPCSMKEICYYISNSKTKPSNPTKCVAINTSEPTLTITEPGQYIFFESISNMGNKDLAGPYNLYTTNLSNMVELGDYITMTPTSTSYTISSSDTGYSKNQTINPSELNLWRVISKNNGTIDVVSEYASSNNIYFSGLTGFTKYVGTLNKISSQYTNSKYVVNTRHMGYNGQTENITDMTALNSNTIPWDCSTSSSCAAVESQGGGDLLYTKDMELVKNAIGTLDVYRVSTTARVSYWIASRHYSSSSTSAYFLSRYCIATPQTSSISSVPLYGINSSSNSPYFAIRPILTIKADSIASGNGTSDSPYILK